MIEGLKQGSEPTVAATPPPVAAGSPKGRLEWLLRTRALQAARSAVARPNSSASELRRRARLSYELAERVFDPIEPLRAGSGAALAAELFRESAYWGLCARHHEARAVPPSQLWTSELESELASDLQDPEALLAARHFVCGSDFVSLAELDEEQQLRCARLGKAIASAVQERLEGSDRHVEALLFQRFVRVLSLALVLIAIATAAVTALGDAGQGPDLARGKPWRTSSKWGECDPVAARCGGVRTRIFFHTKEDASPWFEYDLGAAREFSRVTVRNRTDGVPDRAIPLVIEVSHDRETYREVARKTVTFRTWTADFQPQRARYVRLRVARKSWLHLERVSIYRPE